MKVVHVIPNLDIRGGGGNRACAELCESLSIIGVEVVLLYVTCDDKNVFAPKSVKVIPCPWFIFKKYAFSPYMFYCLWHEIRNADIVHIHALWRFSGIAAYLISKILKVPYILQPHGSLHPWKLKHKALIKQLYSFFIEKKIVKNASVIHVESREDEEDVKKYYPLCPTAIVPCGAYADLFLKESSQNYDDILDGYKCITGRICILYLARLDVNKGIDILIKAFKKISVRNPNVDLLLIGPDFNRTWDKIISSGMLSGISDRVFYLGMVSEAEKIYAFKICDFYILPSLSENFGISILEALFSARPVITTTATPWSQLEDIKAGIVVEPTVEGIRYALKKMLNMTEKQLQQMGERGRTFALENFEWHAVAKDMLKIYESVIEKA